MKTTYQKSEESYSSKTSYFNIHVTNFVTKLTFLNVPFLKNSLTIWKQSGAPIEHHEPIAQEWVKLVRL